MAILLVKDVAGAEINDFVGAISLILEIGKRDGRQNMYMIRSLPSTSYQVPKNGIMENATQADRIIIISPLASKNMGQAHAATINAIIA